MAKRMIETDLQEEDIRIEGSLRPKKLNDYIGPVSYTHLTLPTKA